ncbi:MAG: TROVE domain-containing protein [Janthinobacterium lividum]
MKNYLSIFSHRVAAITPQLRPIFGTVPNSAGGHTFPIDDWMRLDRFLILGSEGGSYYASEAPLTRENAQAVQRAIAADGERAVARIVAISQSGRAPKTDPALFALALAASTEDLGTRRAALAALPLVARTGTHLFQFAGFVESARGWGRSLRRAVGAWYDAQPVDRLAYQLVKYRQRGGWSHRDLLRLSHPAVTDPVRAAMFEWVCRRTESEKLPALVQAAIELGRATDGESASALIRAHDLPREAVPTALLNDPAVWAALLERMPLTALVRSLAKLTAVGVLRPLGDHLPLVLSALGDADRLARARLHPLAILMALRTYAQGSGDRGALQWEPVQAVVDALNAAFYTAFRTVEPTGKRLLLALDVSGSMGAGGVAGSSLTPREASAALALMAAATEPQTHIVGFGASMVKLPLSPSMRLDDAVRAVSGLPFGATDCAQPMLYALERGISADAFVVYTDSETWVGPIHPVQALRQYRERTGIAAKLVVVGLISNGFSIADPDDAGMLDVVGFDTAAPAAIADFIRGT